MDRKLLGSNQKQNENKLLKVRAEEEIKRKFKEKLSDEVLEYMIDNYIDNEGNFRWWVEFEYDNEQNEKNISSKLEKIFDNKSEVYLAGDYLEEFLYSDDAKDRLFSMYRGEKEITRKIKIIKLINDVVISRNTDSDYNPSAAAIRSLGKIASSHDQAYLAKTYANIGYLNSIDWHETDYFEDVSLRGMDEEFKDWVDVRSMHDNKFDELSFVFSEGMINSMNASSRDFGSPSEIKDSLEARHLKKIPASEAPGYMGDSDFVYDGDYITTELAPGLVGVYSIKGDLLGWQEISKTKSKENQIDLKNNQLNEANNILNNIGNNKDDIALFKIMANLGFRTQIKKDLNIDIGDFDLRTQFQFLNFIKDANGGKIERVKDFIGEDAQQADVNKRIRSFLSLELDGGMGEDILNLKEKLSQESANILFSEYSRIIDSAKNSAEEIARIYNEIFFDKQANQQEVKQAILMKGFRLLKEAAGKITNSLDDENDQIIEKLISEVKEEERVQKAVVNNLTTTMREMNGQYESVYKTYRETEFNSWVEEMIEGEAQKGTTTAELRDYEDYLRMMKEMEYSPATAMSVNDYEEGLKEKERIEKKFDKKRLEEIMEEIYNYIEKETQKRESKNESLNFDSLYDLTDKIRSLIDLQKSLEAKLDQVVTGNFHAEIDDQLLERSKKIQESVRSVSAMISKSFQGVKVNISPEAVENELFRDLIDIITTSTANQADREAALEKLNELNANVLLTGKIISQLPKEEIAKLNLKNIPHIEKLEEIKASDLLEKPDLLEQIKKIIKQQFPEGDDEVFEQECRTNPNLRLTITLANNKILSFFSKEKKSENIEYIDWFLANPNAPIKGLGEATLRLGFDIEEEKNISYYAVAKPHAKSFQIFVENLDFVAFGGSTSDGEYKDHYARCRRFIDEVTLSKDLSEKEEVDLRKTIEKICDEPNAVKKIILRGKSISVCKVVYHGQDHHDDIKKTDADGWLLNQIEKEYEKGNILARFIPASQDKNNQVFYAIFEKDNASAESNDKLLNVADSFRRKEAKTIQTQKKL